MQAEYANWYEAQPDKFRDSATADALHEIAEFDLNALAA